MFLATTALLLQFLAVPANAAPALATATYSTTNSSGSEVAAAQPDATHPDAGLETSAATSEKSAAAVVPDPNVTYTPGRVAPELMTPATPAESSSFTPSPVVLKSAEIEDARLWQQRQKRIWMGLNIIQSSAATFDAWSTRRVISTEQGQELNPMLRPFAGNDSLYAAIQVGPLLLDYVGRRMMMSHHRWARHTWWIPQAVGTAVSLAGGINNVGVLNAH